METITTTSWRALTVLFFALGFQLSFGQVVYVDQDATGTGDGASWANAMTDLQGAIDAAASVSTSANPIQVWIKADTYYPTSGTDRTISFVMKNYVEIYGGFLGTETNLMDRDWITNETILSGEIGSPTTNNDNSDHVIFNDYPIVSPLISALLDGVIIEDGFAYLSGATTTGGGGIKNVNASPIIQNCTFRRNTGMGWGGAILNTQESHPIIHSNRFYDNVGNFGGCIAFRDQTTNTAYNVESIIANNLFYDNLANSVGGAIYVANYFVGIANNTITQNEAQQGGGIFYLVISGGTVTSAAYDNNILWGNIGTNSGTDNQQIKLNSPGPMLTSNIIEGGFTGTSTIDADPIFNDAINKDFSLNKCGDSPAIDAGIASTLVSFLSVDLAQSARVFNNSIDLGAFEKQALPLEINSIGLGSPSCNGDSNGEINVAASGGSGAPIHYSIDGVNFSANAVFSGISAGNYTITVLDTGTGCTLSENGTVTEPSNFSVTASSTDIACNGDNNGTITGTVSGASGPYVVSLNGNTATGQFTSDFTIENLIPGNYGLTIVDGNGCDYTHPTSFVIDQPDAITASVSIEDVLCNGESTGSFTVNAAGGTAPLYYTIEGLNSNYLTSPIFENLVAGSYTLTVIDSKLCYEEFSVMISEPTELTVNVSSTTDPTCDGQPDGSISVSGSGGTPSLFYSIDGVNFVATSTFSDLAAGTYAITVEDENGCRAEVSETIENQINLTLNTVSSVDVSCNGETDGAFEVSLSGGTAERFSIPNVAPQSSGLFQNLAAGSYEVTGQDTNGCTTTLTIDILEPDVLTLSVNQSGAGFSLSASGGTAPYEYSLDGTTFQTSPNFQNLDGGLYTFTAKDANDCTVESAEFNLVLGSIDNQLRIYPNPVTNVLKVEGVDFDRLTVYDLSGNELMSTRDREIMLRNFKNGVYIVRLHDKLGNELATRKILKN